MRKEFILYRRKKAKGAVYYAAFWDGRKYSGWVSCDALLSRLGEEYRHMKPETKTGAEAIVRQWLSSGKTPARGNLLLSDYLLSFWDENSEYIQGKKLRGRNISTEYIRGNSNSLKQYLLPFLSGRQIYISDVGPSFLEQFLRHMTAQGVSARRVNVVYQALTVPLGEAFRMGLIRENPASRVQKLAEIKAVKSIFTPEEARAFFSCPAGEDVRPYLANLLAAVSGMRIGEIRGLTFGNLHADWVDVCRNWQDAEGLKPPKAGSSRAVFIPARVSEMLRGLVNPWGNDFVFCGSRRSLPIGKRPIEEYFRKTCHKIGIEEPARKARGLTFHSWRHWYNSMLRGRIPDHALRKLTGHRNEETQDRYTQLTASVGDDHRAVVLGLADQIIPAMK